MKSDIRSILLFVLFACHAIAIAMTATGERAVCAVARSLYKASDALRAACTLVVGTFHALHKAAFLSAGHPALALASVALVAAKHFALRILRRPHAGVHSRYVWNNRPV